MISNDEGVMFILFGFLCFCCRMLIRMIMSIVRCFFQLARDFPSLQKRDSGFTVFRTLDGLADKQWRTEPEAVLPLTHSDDSVDGRSDTYKRTWTRNRRLVYATNFAHMTMVHDVSGVSSTSSCTISQWMFTAGPIFKR